MSFPSVGDTYPEEGECAKNYLSRTEEKFLVEMWRLLIGRFLVLGGSHDMCQPDTTLIDILRKKKLR